MKQLFFDETGKISMKRLCGLLCTVALCATMYHNSFSEAHIAPSPVLVDSVALLAFGFCDWLWIEIIKLIESFFQDQIQRSRIVRF